MQFLAANSEKKEIRQISEIKGNSLFKTLFPNLLEEKQNAHTYHFQKFIAMSLFSFTIEYMTIFIFSILACLVVIHSSKLIWYFKFNLANSKSKELIF